jgi:hypothetical protein
MTHMSVNKLDKPLLRCISTCISFVTSYKFLRSCNLCVLVRLSHPARTGSLGIQSKFRHCIDAAILIRIVLYMQLECLTVRLSVHRKLLAVKSCQRRFRAASTDTHEAQDRLFGIVPS